MNTHAHTYTHVTHTYTHVTHTYTHILTCTHRTHGTTTTEPAAMGPGRERRKALFYPQTLPTTTALLYSTLLFLFTKVSKPYCHHHYNHHHSTRSSRTITIIYIALLTPPCMCVCENARVSVVHNIKPFYFHHHHLCFHHHHALLFLR